MRIKAIKCDNGKFFIIDASESMHESDFLKLQINGKHPEKSFCDDWFIVNSKPKKIVRTILQNNTNYRYELKDKTLKSNKFPLVFKRELVESSIDTDYWKDEYADLRSLYKLVSDKQPPIIKNVDFELEVLIKVKNVPKPDEFIYDVASEQWMSGALRTTVTQKNIRHQLLDKLLFPKPLWNTLACKLSSHDTYKIVRQYIKQNINLKCAKITSDYKFCFTVQRVIPLSEPEKYTVNTNMFTKRNPKYETRFRRERLVTCFDMTYSPENYSGYTPIQGFEGKSQKDLKLKIDTYCEDLIKFINKPLRDCKYCKGLGVIVPKFNAQEKV